MSEVYKFKARLREIKLYLEADFFEENEDGTPASASLTYIFGKTSKAYNYKELFASIDLRNLLKHTGFGWIPMDHVRIITPEEYNARYADKRKVKRPHSVREFS